MGTAERKEREKEQRRNLILDCSEKLFFSKGYNGTSMDDIAKESEYSKGSLYTYFKSKEEILAHIYKRAIVLMFNMFKQYASNADCGIERLKQIGIANFDFMSKYKDYHNMMQMFDTMELDRNALQDLMFEINAQSKSIINFISQTIAEGQRDGTVNKNLDPVPTAHIMAATSKGIFQWISDLKVKNRNHDTIAPNSLFEQYFEFMYYALRN